MKKKKLSLESKNGLPEFFVEGKWIFEGHRSQTMPGHPLGPMRVPEAPRDELGGSRNLGELARPHREDLQVPGVPRRSRQSPIEIRDLGGL